MDPLATLRELADALDDGDIDLAREYLAAYLGWRAAGGFEPVMSDGQRGDDLCADCERRMLRSYSGQR